MSQMQVHRSVCVFESVFVTVSVEVFSYEEKEGQVPVSRSVVVSSGHMGEPWGHEMSIQLFSTEHICQMQNKLLFTEQKSQMLIANCFPQNESSDGDSSSSTYGQIKTFESFFEVKITIRKYVQVFMTNFFRAQIRWNLLMFT